MPLGKSYTVGVRLGLRAGAFSAGLKRSAGLTRHFGSVVQRTAGLSTRGLRGVAGAAGRIGQAFQRTAGIARTVGTATRRMSDGMMSALGRTRRRVDSLIGRMRQLRTTTAGAGSGAGRLLGAAGGAYGAARLISGEMTLQERYTRLGIQAGLSPAETKAARLEMATTASAEGVTNDQLLAGISAYVARGGLFENAFNARAEIARAIVRSGAEPRDIGALLGDSAQQLGIVAPDAVERSAARLAAGEDVGAILLQDSAKLMVPIVAGLATLGQTQEQALADAVLMLQTAGAAIGSPEKSGTAVEGALGYLPDLAENLRAKGVNMQQTPIDIFRDVARNEEALKLFPIESKRFIRGLVSEAGTMLAQRLQPLLDSPDLGDYLADTDRIRQEESVKLRRAMSDLRETFGQKVGPLVTPAVGFAADHPYAAGAGALGAYGVYRGARFGVGRLAGAAGLAVTAAATGGAGGRMGAPSAMGPIRRMTVTAGTVIVRGAAGNVAGRTAGRGGTMVAAGTAATGAAAGGMFRRAGGMFRQAGGLMRAVAGKAKVLGRGTAPIALTLGGLEVAGALAAGDRKGAVEAAAGTGGALAGAAGGAALGFATGPAAPVAVPLFSLIGGGLGYWGASSAADWAMGDDDEGAAADADSEPPDNAFVRRAQQRRAARGDLDLPPATAPADADSEPPDNAFVRRAQQRRAAAGDRAITVNDYSKTEIVVQDATDPAATGREIVREMERDRAARHQRLRASVVDDTAVDPSF